MLQNGMDQAEGQDGGENAGARSGRRALTGLSEVMAKYGENEVVIHDKSKASARV